MKARFLLTLMLCACFVFAYAQNDTPEREAFTLILPVDGKQQYEEEVRAGPYFVKEGTLQIYPGDTLLIEVEPAKKEISSMKVVRYNLNPEKTVKVEFTQTVEDGQSQFMMLSVTNPFKKDLEYKAMMFLAGHDEWVETNVLPVQAKISGVELWRDVIITLALYDWKLI